MRRDHWDPDPIIVASAGDGCWQVRNGRHRLLAAIMAGRADVLCVEEMS
jgi:ParB-like chromosome segregation protein Spo0J